MYHGEVNVAQDDLNSFLAVAEELQIKGLTNKDQADTAGTSSGKVTRPTPVRSTDPGPPLKRVRKSSPALSQLPVTALPDDEDEIKEVVNVKMDPEVSLPVDTDEAVNPDEEVYDESYGEYYDNESGGMEGDGGEDESGAGGSVDAAKGRNFKIVF